MPADWEAHGYYTLGNGASLLIQISDCGDEVRYSYNGEVSDWIEVEYNLYLNEDNENEGAPMFLWGEIWIRLDEVMRINK